MLEYDFIMNILMQSGMDEDEAEDHIMNLLEQEAEFYLACKRTLEPLDDMSIEEREKLVEYIKEMEKKTMN